MDQMLTQDEINALLGSMDEGGDSAEATTAGDSLTSEEKDAVGEISNISMGTAATTLSTLLNQRVNITTPSISYATWNDISEKYDRPCVFIQISYIEGLDGNNVLILREKDVKIITDLMMGGDGTNTEDSELTDLHLSAICEAMNQMMGSAATSISSMLEKKVDISPPVASLIDLNDTISSENLSDFLRGDFVKVSFRLEIGDLIDSELMQLYPFDFARDLFKKFIESNEALSMPAQEAPAPAPAPAPSPAPAPQAAAPSAAPQPAPMPQMQMPQMDMATMQAMQMQMMQQQPMPNVNVAPVQFQNFNPGINPVMQQENIDLIMDVPLEVSVELGRTNKSIKEILDFSPGTIIELNKLAGEAIDVLVNGKYVAKGEVVVIEDSFGIRLTEIVR